MTEDIERYRGLAARWAAYEDASMLVRDETSEMGWSVAVELSDAEQAELLGWMRRSMHDMVMADVAVFGEPPSVAGPFDDGDEVVFVVTQRGPAPCREALAHAIMTKLGWETLGSDPHGEHGLAWLLCEAAGWPEVSS